MIFSWLKQRRRRHLAAAPFPAAWDAVLRQNVLHYRALTTTEQMQVQRSVQVLVAEKNWEACGGLQLTDEVKVTIAGQIGVLTLGLPEQYFDHVLSILIYPDAYVARDTTVLANGLVLEGDSVREGEAWYRGPVVLSWPEVLEGGRRQSPGHNLVFHEFAHQLDMLNGHHVDGIPLLASPAQLERWNQVVPAHYQQLVDDCLHGRSTVLDCYGATDPAEFFAVATEAFFESARALQHRHGALYTVLRDFYGQDPAARER